MFSVSLVASATLMLSTTMTLSITFLYKRVAKLIAFLSSAPTIFGIVVVV